MEIRWFPDALADLEAIFAYIHADAPKAAEEIVAEIISTIDLLRQNPKLGRTGRFPHTRELVVPPYVVVYRQDEAAIAILTVHHAARRWPDDMPDLVGN